VLLQQGKLGSLRTLAKDLLETFQEAGFRQDAELALHYLRLT
jgi:hypothetical protein